MEGQPMVSYLAGPMNSLVDKLTKLMRSCQGIEGLVKDLVNLKNFFHQVAGQHDMNFRVEMWLNLVRELAFDIEDWVDQKPDMGEYQLEVEEEVQPFKGRIAHLFELCRRYNLFIGMPTDHPHEPAVAPRQVTVDSRILFGGENVLVGLEKPTEDLINLLLGNNEMKRTVVCIVGMEGLGKTTLAKEVYEKFQLESQFDCWASISVGKRPSMRNTLKEILCQVKLCEKERVEPKPNPMYARGPAEDLETLISELREYLGLKRYFILVDGLCSIEAWSLISCALPDGNLGSRVLTTTSINGVAKFCSVVHHMEALDEKMSTRLYLKAIGQRECLEDCDEAAKNILKTCGGMPLAITVAAGLLATESGKMPERKILRRTALSSVDLHSRSEGMMKILLKSFAALSLPLQSCLLYLSVFRENYTIKKDRIIRLWIAEGYIPREDKERRGEEERVEETIGHEEGTTRGEESLWETGERYFNELIMRRLIEPVFNFNDDQAVGCTVHSVILDFIKSLSMKGNFVTVGIANLRTNLARRFSLDCYGDQDEDGTLASIRLHLSVVRSITVLGDIEGMDGRSALTESGEIEGRPVLPFFKLIRVLDLQGTVSLGSHHLEGIGGLVLLKYLGVAETNIDKLPEEIGELEQLETLDLRHTKLSTLPESIVKQKRLAHLLIDYTVKLPSGIQKMRGLEEVSTINVDSEISVVELVELLKNLERLRVLGVRLDRDMSYGEFEHRVFSSSTNLSSLTLYCPYEYLLTYPLCPPPGQLRRFELTISAPILADQLLLFVPPLGNVTHIDIEVVELDQRALHQLGKFPNLVFLKLVSTGMNSQSEGEKSRHAVSVDGGFSCLKVFSFTCGSGGTKLQFSSSAMKELQRLSLEFSAHETLSLYGNFCFGINHLSSLTRVHVTIDCKSAAALEVKNAVDAIRAVLGKLCRDLTVEFTKTHLMTQSKGGKSISSTLEETM